jgi:hypothetical protein
MKNQQFVDILKKITKKSKRWKIIERVKLMEIEAKLKKIFSFWISFRRT